MFLLNGIGAGNQHPQSLQGADIGFVRISGNVADHDQAGLPVAVFEGVGRQLAKRHSDDLFVFASGIEDQRGRGFRGVAVSQHLIGYPINGAD